MNRQFVLIGVVLAIGLGIALGLRWFTTPQLPELDLSAARKEVVEAIETAREEVRRNPRSGAAWGKLGLVLAANGFPSPAITCLDHAARFEPDNPLWPCAKAGQLTVLGESHGIAPELRRAISLTGSPDDRAALTFRLANHLIELGELDEADRLLGELRTSHPRDPRPFFGLGLIAAARDDRPTARDFLRRATEDPVTRKGATALLATLEESPELARAYSERAERLPPDVLWLSSFDEKLASVHVTPPDPLSKYKELSRQGRTQEALTTLIEFAPSSRDPEVHFTLGLAHLQAGNLSGATAAFRQVVVLDPRHAKGYLLLGSVLGGQAEEHTLAGRSAEASESYRQALEAADHALAIDGGLALAHLLRSKALKPLGRQEDALAALREAVRNQPSSAEMHQALGEALAESGRSSEGIPELEAAVKLADPNDPKPRAALEKWRAKTKTP